MTLASGKLYACDEHYIMLYPKKSFVEHYSSDPWFGSHINLGKYYNPGTLFLVLSIDDAFIEILTGESTGWFRKEFWMKFKEIK